MSLSVRDLVLVSLGELILAATFALGIAVGISLSTRKDSSNDGNSDEGTEDQVTPGAWRR